MKNGFESFREIRSMYLWLQRKELGSMNKTPINIVRVTATATQHRGQKHPAMGGAGSRVRHSASNLIRSQDFRGHLGLGVGE